MSLTNRRVDPYGVGLNPDLKGRGNCIRRAEESERLKWEGLVVMEMKIPV